MELADGELECVVAGKGTPQLFGRMASTAPFVPLFPRLWWSMAVAK